MIELVAKDLGKKFFRHWVFRHIDLQLQSGQHLLLAGENGSGKSTLMRILAGQMAPSQGSLQLLLGGKAIDPENYYRHLAWSGPYMDLYTDLSLDEHIRMQANFRPFYVSPKEVAALLGLEGHEQKLLKHFSSGMLHRVKVGLAILSQSKILLLDEATTNMDETNSKLVMDLMWQFLHDRILIFASNKTEDFAGFEQQLWLKKA
jgi:ABC-type multidrug transport system ATPase subunit